MTLEDRMTEPKCRHCPEAAASPDAKNCSCCCHRAIREAEQWRQMSRADRRGNMCLDSMACDDGGEHNWIPVSFRFETQLLDEHGRVSVRQPDLKQGRGTSVTAILKSASAHVEFSARLAAGTEEG